MKGELNSIVATNILCEFLETAIHSILYTRKLYPETIFRRKRKYGVIVYQSVHPEVNSYIAQCLKAISFHVKKCKLKSIVLCFHCEEKIIEKYTFKIKDLSTSLDSDPFAVKLEQYFSEFHIKLSTPVNCLNSLPDNSTFSLRLHVSEYSNLEFNQEPEYENFPWITLNNSESNNSLSSEIIPVHSIKTDFLKLQIYRMMCETTSRKRKHCHGSPMEGSKTVKGIFKKDDLDDSLSTSDWGLVIDDNYKSRKRTRTVRLGEEPLSLTCEWDSCCQDFTEYVPFNNHLKQHLEIYSAILRGQLQCCWLECNYIAVSMSDLNQHVCYHGYHTKLKSLGRNVEFRAKLPQCTQTEQFVFPVVSNGYRCEWVHCDEVLQTIFEYFEHVKFHVFHNPTNGKKGVINCCWKGCTTGLKFPSQYKLSEHLRIHTKEKIIACPTCGNLFANKTKFCDHRKRQIPINLQSYLCSQCSKYFPSERLLRDHMRLHINHYKCSMCEMTCPKPSILAKHIRYRHLNEKPYKCERCNYRCVSKHNLDFHLRKHDPKSQFKCSDCQYECRSAFGLDRHYQRAHGKSLNVYECHNCKQQFQRGGLLTKHLMKVHNYHWPSGHSRFRYKEDQDGIYRLQTVRYETLDVTEEIIKGAMVQAPSEKEPLKFNVLKRDDDNKNSVQTFDIVLATESDEDSQIESRKQVVITIDDIDSKGNVLQSQTIQSSEIICEDLELQNNSLKSEIFYVDSDEKSGTPKDPL